MNDSNSGRKSPWYYLALINACWALTYLLLGCCSAAASCTQEGRKPTLQQTSK